MADTIFITGVAGFLGRYIAREFAEGGWDVVGVDVVEPEQAPEEVSYAQVSLPSPTAPKLAATAAAVPPLEPAVERSSA